MIISETLSNGISSRTIMPTESDCCIEMKQVWFSSLITVIITYLSSACRLCIRYRAPPLDPPCWQDSSGKTSLFTCVVNSVVEEVFAIPHCFTMPGSKNCSSVCHKKPSADIRHFSIASTQSSDFNVKCSSGE